jgi:Uma2 family endonuclease
MSTELRRRPFTVDEYHRIAEAGVFGEDDRVELLEGEIIEMTPIGGRHARRVTMLAHRFHQQVGDRLIVSVQNPIRLSERSEPQPDLALLRWRDDFYPELPTAEDVVLVVEVADTSGSVDRVTKLPAYGRAGIAEAWLVDLAAGVVEIHLEPSAAGYRQVNLHRPGHVVSATVAPGLTVVIDEIFG